MAKPSVLTRLVKGKALGAFPNFVDTWNYVIDFIENLRGDGDDDREKSIVVDRTVEDHPVIRMSDSGGTDDLEVITDVEFVIEDGFLQLKMTKAKLKNVSYDEVEYDEELHRRPVAGVLTKNVVTDTMYNDDGEHTFDMKRVDDVMILYPKDAGTVPTEEDHQVFETTLHQ